MKRSLYLHLKRSLDARMFSFQVHIFNARECVWKLAEKKVDESLLRKFSIWFAWFSKVYKLSFNILVYLEVLKKFLWWTKLNNIDIFYGIWIKQSGAMVFILNLDKVSLKKLFPTMNG